MISSEKACSGQERHAEGLDGRRPRTGSIASGASGRTPSTRAATAVSSEREDADAGDERERPGPRERR